MPSTNTKTNKTRETLTVDPGLEGVVVGQTRVSEVDGEHGQLRYRGHDIDELTSKPFAEVASLVALGKVVPPLCTLLDNPRALSKRERELILNLPGDHSPMQVLQGAIVLLDADQGAPVLGASALDQIMPGELLPAGLPAQAERALAIASKAPEIVATHFARQAVSSTHTEYCQRFTDMIGVPAAQTELIDAFRIMQILQLEHSFNASTFAARVIASTQAPIENALAGAVGTLHGVLHGGADQAALETADEVADPQAAAAFVDRALATGHKVMGMGHREYKVLDPRASYGKSLAQTLTAGTQHERTFETLAAIEARFTERMAQRGKPLYANIEFYKGLIFRVMGLPPAYFTALFAMARLFGYIAHVLESRYNSRLIRPAAHYVGPIGGAVQ